ncbi:MAG: PEP-CTERM sorting domain-containing protein [Armatimonadetes bacterium]|nr:PEP-CTERM sorting domain-containing protein [Armatimonadota bacterium]
MVKHLCVLAVVLGVPVVSRAQSSFVKVGGGPSIFASRVFAGSADGSTAACVSYSSQATFGSVWTQANGTTTLGLLSGTTYSEPHGVSANGSAITGTALTTGGDYRAFRWTSSGGIQSLAALAGDTKTYGQAISGDGSVVVGSSASFGARAVRWLSNGTAQNLGFVSGGNFSAANGVSGDGSVVVGESGNSSFFHAFRWTSGAGMQDLGTLPGGTLSRAFGISADGSTIFGGSNSPVGNDRGFRWTASGGMENIGLLADGLGCQIYGSSQDGNALVGTCYTTSGQRAFLWQQGIGMRPLNSVLIEAGLGSEMAGINLVDARSVSVVGGKMYITCNGSNNSGQAQAFLATVAVPEPTSVIGFAVLVSGASLRRRKSEAPNRGNLNSRH